jgi:alkanesulfonate monooxygenase SsuD/methylene tetrahydromethanopterin reductase-like flavin-dependent oxidoreductase (luciferase family)
MKFALFSLIINTPSPLTGERLTPQQKLRSVVDQAVLAEELGFEAFGVGERHGEPFLSSAPPVVLAAIAERTQRIRLLTTVTVLSILDPVRVAEDYATLDNLSGGRLELIIGKGNDPRHFPLFGLDEARQWDYMAEKYPLLRRLWREENVTWAGESRAPLRDVTTQPRPLQQPIPIWHGSASSEQSTELAAKWGDPLFSANGFHHQSKYQALIDHYRDRWAHYGHAGEPVVGAGAGGFYVAKTSQEARERYRPYFDAQRRTAAAKHNNSPFQTLDDAIDNGPTLVGSPEEVLDKVHNYHEAFGHQVLSVGVEALPPDEQRDVLELFFAEVAPQLRRSYPSTVWEAPVSDSANPAR